MKYMEKPTTRFKQVTSLLNELLQTEGEDVVNRAFAEVVSASRQGMQGVHGARKGSGHVCYHRLLGKRCPRDKCLSPTIVPGNDHTTEWKSGGKTKSIIAQPYGLSYEEIKELVDFCEKNHLKATIEAQTSWHFPGRTISIEYIRHE